MTRRHAAILAAAVALTSAVAALLAVDLGVPGLQAAGLPLLTIGLLLAWWNTHWALCFAAFAITPFGVVQQEVLGVTLNLPEVLILLLAAKEGIRFLRQRTGLPTALPVWPVAVFLIAAAVALGTGLARDNGTVRTLQDFRQFTEFLVLFWLVLQCVAGRDEALRIAFCYVLGATVLAIHGIVQQVVPVGISETQISSDLILHHGIRSSSFYGATPLGGLMVLAIAPAAGVVLSSKRRSIQVLMALCIILCLLAIVFTRTRGSWLGLAVALALIAVSVRPSGKTLAAVAGAGMVLALVLGPLVVQRLYTLADPEQDISLMARAQYYAAASHIGQAHPFLDLGWGCYYDIDEILRAERYVVTPFEEANAEEGEFEEATVHSAYLQLFVKTGVPGLLAFLAIVVVWLERIWHGRNTRFQSDSTHALFIGVTAGIAGYLFHSTFENFFQWPVMAQSFWLLFGLSFLLAPRPEGQSRRYGVPLAFVASAAAVFLIFMYACQRLETLHTDHYERNVAKALEEGDLEKALHIARRATEVDLYEPMPFTVYARLLFMRGDDAAALAALETAFGTVERPPAPRNRFTGARYYFAPARLTLGKYHAERGAWDRALQQFELARAYGDLQNEVYADFHPLLYRAYATRGRWARALAFGRPTAEQLDELNSVSLLRMARVCEATEDWDFLQELANRLRSRGVYQNETDYFQGRAHLAKGEAQAALEMLADAEGEYDARAPFFMGEALEELGRADEARLTYLGTRDPAYRPVALAKAWQSRQSGGDFGNSEGLLTELQWIVERMAAVPADEQPQDTKLLAYTLPDSTATYGTRFPALFLWGEGPVDLSGLKGLSVTRPGTSHVIHLEGTAQVLELRWVENLVDWESVECAYPTDDVLPGWIDSARDWFDLTEAPGAVVADDDAENSVLKLDGLAWVFSVPVVVPEDTSLLFSAHIRDVEGAGVVGWHFLDEDSLVARSGLLANHEKVEAWTRRTAWLPPDATRNTVRVMLETGWPGSEAAMRDAVLLSVAPPAMALP